VSTVPGQTAFRPDVLFREIHRDRSRQSDQTVFADRVRKNVLLTREGLNRRDVHDRPATVRTHVREGRTCRVPGALEVHSEHFVPLRVVGRDRGAVSLYAGTHNKRIDRTELRAR
jgi:hypothetical protein